MLGKLIIFDMKSSSRLLLPLHIAVLVTTAIGGCMLSFDLWQAIPELFLALILIFYILLLAAAGMISSFYFVYWFYRNLFTDEGYLMHTLPVRPWQHIVSKLTGMFLWEIIDFFVILLCVFLLVSAGTHLPVDLLQMAGYAFETAAFSLNSTPGQLIFLFGSLLVLDILVKELAAFMCIAIGQLFNRHRLLAAFVVYLLMTIALSIASTAVFIMLGLPDIPADSIHYLRISVSFELIYNLILSAVCFFVTNYLMEKRLNLE